MANVINYDLLWQEIGRYAKKVGRQQDVQMVVIVTRKPSKHLKSTLQGAFFARNLREFGRNCVILQRNINGSLYKHGFTLCNSTIGKMK